MRPSPSRASQIIFIKKIEHEIKRDFIQNLGNFTKFERNLTKTEKKPNLTVVEDVEVLLLDGVAVAAAGRWALPRCCRPWALPRRCCR